MTTSSASPSAPTKASRWRRSWRHIRVVLVFYHVAAVALFALPPPGNMDDRKAWKTDHTQRDLKGWAETLSALGPDISPDSLEEILFSVSTSYVKWSQRAATWFTGYVRYTGTRQGWRMFTSPQVRPAMLTVEIGAPTGPWTLVYQKNSARHAWLSWAFDHNRLRKLHGRLARDTHKRAFQEVALWIARQAAQQFPEAERTRVRLLRTKTPSPLELYAGFRHEPEIDNEKVYSLEALR